MLRVVSLPETMVSKNEIFPSCSRSIVNEILGWILFRVWWNVETAFFLVIIKQSSTYLYHFLGGVVACLVAISSTVF